jgi:hypothetical protein
VGSRTGSASGGHGSPRSRARSAGVWIGGLSDGVRWPKSLNAVIRGRFSTASKIRSRSTRVSVSFCRSS